MRLLFYLEGFDVVGILDEKTKNIAVTTCNSLLKHLEEVELKSKLVNSPKVSSKVTYVSVDDKNYYFLYTGKLLVYKGIYTESNNYSEGVVNTNKGVLTYRVYKDDFRLDLGLSDNTKDIEIKSNAKSDCKKCKGKGFYELNGINISCSCTASSKEIKSSNIVHTAIKVDNATKINCCSIGLVPEEYIDTEFNSSKIISDLRDIGSNLEDFSLVNVDRFMSTLDSILIACKTGSKLKHSYLLACDKGFGKLEFVYDCLKYLYKRNQICCKYISLQELGSLRADSIKKAQSIVNCSYYYKDNDRELIQRTIEDEGRNIIRTLMKSWLDITSDSNTKLGLKKSLKKLEDSLLEKVYSKSNLPDSTLSLYNDTKHILINTWEDYLSYPIVFVYFSGTLDRHYETEVLQELLNIRGTKSLPTVCFIESSLGIFKDEPTYFDNGKGGTVIDLAKTKSYFWLNMLSNESSFMASNIDINSQDREIATKIEYDRMIYINSYIDYKNRFKLGD